MLVINKFNCRWKEAVNKKSTLSSFLLFILLTTLFPISVKGDPTSGSSCSSCCYFTHILRNNNNHDQFPYCMWSRSSAFAKPFKKTLSQLSSLRIQPSPVITAISSTTQTKLFCFLLPSSKYQHQYSNKYSMSWDPISNKSNKSFSKKNKIRNNIGLSTSSCKRRLLHNSSSFISSFSSTGSISRPLTTDLRSASMNEVENDSKQQERPLVIILAGSTGVGKSAVAASLCSSIRATQLLRRDDKRGQAVGHVISADSVQAYKEVQIGANKPTLEERRKTAHHLIDLVDAQSNYNAADWRKDAIYVIQQLTKTAPNETFSKNIQNNESNNLTPKNNNSTGNDISISSSDEEEGNAEISSSHFHKRRLLIENQLSNDRQQTSPITNDNDEHILPVVVGGTMMYLQWLVHGRPDTMKPSSTAVEKACKKISSYMALGEDGWEAAVEYTKSLGPLFERRVNEKLSAQDWYRLRRILEVAYTAFELKKNTSNDENDTNDRYEEIISKLYSGQRYGGLEDYGYDVRCFFLCPDDRMQHTALVDARCEDMLIRGLLQETCSLYLNGHLPPDGQVARAIGYRQSLEYLKRSAAKENDKKAFDQYLNNFATATRRYAKKQMQWFRRDNKFIFVPISVHKDKDDDSLEKENPIESAADIIQRMCLLSRQDYEKELLTYDNSFKSDKINLFEKGKRTRAAQGDDYYLTKEEEQLPLSRKVKLLNERQGENMKFYMPTRHKLKEGTEILQKVLTEADTCTNLLGTNDE